MVGTRRHGRIGAASGRSLGPALVAVALVIADVALLGSPAPAAAPAKPAAPTPAAVAAPGKGVIKEYTVGGAPLYIANGPDGNYWFTDQANNLIGRITPAGTVTTFPVPTPGSWPWGIAAGPDGNVWFTERIGNKIGRITPSGVIAEFALPTPNSQPLDITTGPDGALWFTEPAGRIGRITTDGAISELSPGGGPAGITTGPDGNLWYTDSGFNAIFRMTPAGVTTRFDLGNDPITYSNTPAGITAGPDGALWFAETDSHKIGRIATDGTLTQFRLPGGASAQGTSPVDIVAGPDGALWFTDQSTNHIGRITTDGSAVLFATGSVTNGIATGPDGNVWFTEPAAGKIGVFPASTTLPVVGSLSPGIGAPEGGTTVVIAGINFTGATRVTFGGVAATSFTVDSPTQITAISPPGARTVDVAVTTPKGTSAASSGTKFTYTPYREFPLPTAGAFPRGITNGPDGNLWFTESAANKVARITPAGVLTEFPLPTFQSQPGDITTGSDGNLWFTESGRIGRITPAGALTEFPLPHPTQFPSGYGITKGPDGNLWFVFYGGSPAIGRITPSGKITLFPLPAASGGAADITTGPDGNLWFTEDNRIAKITPNGRITEFPAIADPNAHLGAITLGPDGNLWFTETYYNGTFPRIGRITPAGVVTEFYLPPGATYSDNIADITAGPDGALWYTRPTDHRVGRITTKGVVGEWTIPVANRLPESITTGPDGALWFTDTIGNVIGTFAPFTPRPAPSEVRQVSPRTGLPGGGTQVIIGGVNLQKATGVSFGGTPAASFTVLDAGHIAATSPAHAVGTADVTVTTPAGTTATSAGSQFFYSSPGCGKTITASTTLTADIGPCFGDGVVIGADNVTLDLGGHRIFSFPEPSDGNAAGVRLPNRSGVHVQNGTITGFDGGVFVNHGSANTVTNLTLEDNIGPDDPNATLGDGVALFESANNTVANDTIVHNGHYDGIGCLGGGCNGNTFRDNDVENNIGPANHGPGGEGIIITNFLDSNNGAAIAHNDVLDNTVRGNGAAGISNINNTESEIRHNLVEDNGLVNQIGNGIGVSVGPAAVQPDTHMYVADNTVRHNGDNGIVDAYGAHSNRFVSNTSTDNNVNNRGYKDLRDENPECDANVWKANIWGAAGYDPPCTATGGSGPPPPAAAAAAAAAKPADAPKPVLRRSPPGL